MIFVDSNVFVYAVGGPHPLRIEAQEFFLQSRRAGAGLATSAEVLQERLHICLPVGRMQTLGAARELATHGTDRVLPVTPEDVLHARSPADRHPGLTARDLLHLSICFRHRIRRIKTFDRGLLAAFHP